MPVTPLRDSDPVRVGPHRLLGRLGQGGMGTVYLGVTADDRAVAVKVLRDGPADPEARRRFCHELDALRRVRGPHLVEVLDADVDADLPYLVTRFVPGTRLDDLVTRNGPLDLQALRPLARGLADALTGLHAGGVVHRDLTPGNVLVLDGQPHVIDLGLATAADVTALTRSGLVIGTPGYLAPEQVTGLPATQAVDVHAWGATVAFAATGRPPYGTGRPEAVLYRIVHGEPDLDGVPAELLGLVAAAMDADPDRRPDARTLLADLGGASHARTVQVRLAPGVQPGDVPPGEGSTSVLTSLGATRTLVGAASGPHATASPTEPPATRARHVVPWDEPTGVTAEGAGPAGDGTTALSLTRDGRAPDDGWTGDDRTEDDRTGDDWAGDEDSVLAPLPPRTHPVRALQVAVTATVALAAVAAATLVAPVVGVASVLLLLVVLRAVGRGGERLRDRQDRRGQRRRDPLVATVGAPWHLVLALGDTVTSLPLLLLVAAVPAGAVYLSDPVLQGLERDELTVATAAAVVLVAGLARRVHRRSRLLLRRTMLTLTPGAASATALVAALSLIGVLLLATAEGRAPLWYPFTR